MAYQTVTYDNAFYQIRSNIIEYIQSQLSSITIREIKFYTSIPDLTSRKKVGLPFIVLPEIPFDEETEHLGFNGVYSGTIDGTIYHDFDKLGDNAVRYIKQALLTLNKRDAQDVLSPYGVRTVNCSLAVGNAVIDIEDAKSLNSYDFTISFQTLLTAE